MTTAQRTLRRKAERALLWYAAGGRCQLCGTALEANWQADHRVPWIVSGRTNVHEMQALCAPCNRRKGSRMFREHQDAFDRVCREIQLGRQIAQIFMQVTPGGGKSLIPIIGAHHLVPAKFDRICWVVPRGTLRRQAEKNFVDAGLRKVVHHRHVIRISVNDVDPSRGLSGFVTTFQAVSENPKLLSDEFERLRYVLFIDEAHHLQVDSKWHRAMAPAIERAGLVVFMSGTWDRGKHYRIAYLPYRAERDGYVPDFPAPGDVQARVVSIAYPRRRALAEKAIIPLRFFHLDGEVTWRHHGVDVTETLADASIESAPQAIFTALRTGYDEQLLALCDRDWSAYRLDHPRSKMLVVAFDQKAACRYERLLRRAGGRRVGRAISKDGDEGDEAIDRFKKDPACPDALDVLVTVAKAYEGLDVPEITHLACLTNVRARAWIEQMAARPARFDPLAGPYQEQFGFIYCPDDPLMNRIIRQIQAEQEPFVVDPKGPPPPPPGDRESAVPLRSAFTQTRESDLNTGEQLPAPEFDRIVRALDEVGLRGRWDPLAFRQVMQRYHRHDEAAHDPSSGGAATVAGSRQNDDRDEIAPSVREKALRDWITEYIAHREGERKGRDVAYEWGGINYEAKVFFGKGKPEMTLPELERLKQWLLDTYPPLT